MERNCDALAIMLWKRAYPDVDHEAIVSQLYEDSLEKHLRNLPHLDERETHFHADYSYKRSQTVHQLVAQPSNGLSEETLTLSRQIIDRLS